MVAVVIIISSFYLYEQQQHNIVVINENSFLFFFVAPTPLLIFLPFVVVFGLASESLEVVHYCRTPYSLITTALSILTARRILGDERQVVTRVN